ncbi:hypothetical protein PhCBS80983_g03369 [Powellomyces hirtus]|uniref:Gamma-glutamylcyclotransferase AIG2-like domain-containing protein n=1 Tax=Powellomyces hirtus TaxID=109895 RepID=A0A507E497_9FUNG|nr:hypothetical protein PhCBS80983_g03369 [Powellomyces hirtus]
MPSFRLALAARQRQPHARRRPILRLSSSSSNTTCTVLPPAFLCPLLSRRSRTASASTAHDSDTSNSAASRPPHSDRHIKLQHYTHTRHVAASPVPHPSVRRARLLRKHMRQHTLNAPLVPYRSAVAFPPRPASNPEPATHQQPRHYLFGYGSLINPQSRLRTVPTPTTAIPATVHGLQRSWSYPCPRNNYTAVGVTRIPNADNDSVVKCNGVLIPLASEDPESDLRRLDARESHYTRTQLPLSDIHINGDDSGFDPANAIVWVYELTPISSPPVATTTTTATSPSSSSSASPAYHTPTPTIPIPQSYIDCILTGCLQYGPAFAHDFVTHTKGWESGTWINDRHADVSVRRYVRNAAVGEVDSAAPALLDKILQSIVPAAFCARLEL